MNNIHFKKTLLESPAATLMLVIFVIASFACQAQTRSVKKQLYRAWIDMETGFELEGVLYQATDSSLVISGSRNPQDYTHASSLLHFNQVKVQEVEQVKLRKTGRVSSAILIGVLGGFFVGLGRGLVEGDTEYNACIFSSCPETSTGLDKGLGYGVAYGIWGGIIGGVIGSIKIKIPINGHKDQLEANKARLSNYSYMNRR